MATVFLCSRYISVVIISHTNEFYQVQIVNVKISQLLLYDERFSSLTISLSKKIILPMFQLDALVLLSVNEAKSWQTSIYSYIEACRCTLLLIAHIGHAHWLSNFISAGLRHTRTLEVEPVWATSTRQHCKSDSQCTCPMRGPASFDEAIN